jgi:thioredoxin-dependent peroxiredoxin
MIRRSLTSFSSIAALAIAGALCAALAGTPASATLKVGTMAPPFETQASLGGNVFDFKLADALAKGPVVLYFYPAAFTTGCTLEAHDFAEHIGDYQALGATVIGVSADGIAKLQKFSVSECRKKFPVASDGDHKISRAYDATLGFGPIIVSDRTSYVIDKTGKIVYAYHAMDFSKHVANTLDALKKLEGK